MPFDPTSGFAQAVPFGLEEYLDLVDTMGRAVHPSKRGAIPASTPPLLSRLGKDLAVGVGGGLRIDFSYFVIRLDYSFKAKDPSPSPNRANVQNKWFGYKNWSEADQFQLAISYPFIL